ncbi:DUF982 domain-containing protein [Rhizobium sp. Root1220]|uniref:DUF982 domain-containing protein n=1 Tax=Rhizobium sp. Root1220 TaxID=1736432 RepID=UPI0006FDA7E9|nr:DUF982 domain-containing protein [Rhizobium sp. Root1220]KQV78173.1 hypothetical protein ASC90_26985 [Rhizobium sp. Root1220]
MPGTEWDAILIDRHGETYLIALPRGALHVLMSDWPTSEGGSYIAAMEACAGTEEGSVSYGEARAAFLLAAVEAGVYFEGER